MDSWYACPIGRHINGTNDDVVTRTDVRSKDLMSLLSDAYVIGFISAYSFILVISSVVSLVVW